VNQAVQEFEGCLRERLPDATVLREWTLVALDAPRLAILCARE